MSEYQESLLEMTNDEIISELAHILSNLQDIATATDKSFTIIAAPDGKPVLVVDGAVNNDFYYDDIPGFEGTMEELNTLCI